MRGLDLDVLQRSSKYPKWAGECTKIRILRPENDFYLGKGHWDCNLLRPLPQWEGNTPTRRETPLRVPHPHNYALGALFLCLRR